MNPETKTCDLAVVGSTPGGIAMAVRAAREGLSVILSNYHVHPGGLLSSGLAVWDTLYEGRRSPLYDEARATIMEYYRTTYGENSREYQECLPGRTGHTNGKFSASVGERFFRGLIEREPKITFLAPFYPESVERTGAAIRAIILREFKGERRLRVEAVSFADCTYEGDFMALAKAPYRVGRESREEFGEPNAGRIFMSHLPVETPPVYPEITKILDGLDIRHFGNPQRILDGPGSGQADGLVQAMNYRTMLTTDPERRILPTRPDDYDPAYYATLEYGSRVTPVPGDKMGWNRPQLLDHHTDYVEADWEGRQKVLDEHWKATLGLLYYLQNDAPLDPDQRAYWQSYGLDRTEFPDHGHRPYEIYVREARRLEGRAVFTQHDGRPAPGIPRPPLQVDSVAVNEWYFDTHACTRDRIPGSMDEGKMMLHQETLPGQISWRCLLPPNIDNLLVPVCVSASHVAWGGIRLEPTWMHLAESGAWAVILAHRADLPLARIDTDTLIRTLAAHGIMLAFFNDVDVASGEPWIPGVEYFATKGFFPTYDARPDEPLSEEVALAWQKILAEMKSPGFDPTRAAAAVAVAEEKASGPASAATLDRLIGPGISSAGLTRGETCRLLFIHS